jgi:phosphatidylinositol alpha-1,6-mannosyltransferase
VTLDYAPNHGGVSAYWQQVTASMPPESWVVLKPSLFRWFWPRWTLALWQTWRVYRSQGCEMLVAAQVLPIGTIAYILHTLLSIPYVVQLYGMDLALASRSSRKTKLVRKILASAEAVVVNSRATANMTKQFGVDPEQCVVVYPIPVAPRAQQPRKLTGKKIILTVGRLVPRKGQDMVIAAMPLVLRELPNAVYVIVGDGADRSRLESLAQGLGDAVVFTGAVEDAERDAWLAGCDVFIMAARPSADDVEGFGMVYLEAGALGKPVIGGKGGGVVEAIMDGETGLVIDSTSKEEIAKALVKVLKDESFAQKLGQQGREECTSRWNRSKEVEKLMRVLH